MPSLNSGDRGDLLVKVIVKIPEKLTKKQEELMKEAFVGEPEPEMNIIYFERITCVNYRKIHVFIRYFLAWN